MNLFTEICWTFRPDHGLTLIQCFKHHQKVEIPAPLEAQCDVWRFSGCWGNLVIKDLKEKQQKRPRTCKRWADRGRVEGFWCCIRASHLDLEGNAETGACVSGADLGSVPSRLTHEESWSQRLCAIIDVDLRVQPTWCRFLWIGVIVLSLNGLFSADVTFIMGGLF